MGGPVAAAGDLIIEVDFLTLSLGTFLGRFQSFWTVGREG